MSLPRCVTELADVVGLPAALALVKTYGGTYLKVPLGLRPGKVQADLVALIGDDTATLLIRHYGGERVSLPLCAASLRAARDAEIIKQYDAGTSAAILARLYRMTERSVRNILQRVPQPVEGIK